MTRVRGGTNELRIESGNDERQKTGARTDRSKKNDTSFSTVYLRRFERDDDDCGVESAAQTARRDMSEVRQTEEGKTRLMADSWKRGRNEARRSWSYATWRCTPASNRWEPSACPDTS